MPSLNEIPQQNGVANCASTPTRHPTIPTLHREDADQSALNALLQKILPALQAENHATQVHLQHNIPEKKGHNDGSSSDHLSSCPR